MDVCSEENAVLCFIIILTSSYSVLFLLLFTSYFCYYLQAKQIQEARNHFRTRRSERSLDCIDFFGFAKETEWTVSNFSKMGSCIKPTGLQLLPTTFEFSRLKFTFLKRARVDKSSVKRQWEVSKMDFDLSFDSFSPRNKRKLPLDTYSPVSKRRKFSTKDCEECPICSDDVFEICHPHISTVEMLKKKGANGRHNNPIWCQICQRKHSDPKLDQDVRQKLVLGSSTLAHLWKARGYQSKFHIDFDCIIGGQIHDVHLSFERQYKDVPGPFDIVLACGMNNIPTQDSAKQVILQYESFLSSIQDHSKRHKHKKPNRVVICPLLYAPKFCDERLRKDENHLAKIIAINEWIKDFNEATTGLKIKLDDLGVKKKPSSADENVMHNYNDWNEPQWQRMLHLNPDAKSIIAKELVDVLSNLK